MIVVLFLSPVNSMWKLIQENHIQLAMLHNERPVKGVMQIHHFNRSHMGLIESEQESFCSVLMGKNAVLFFRYLITIVCFVVSRSFFKLS